jgi:hypothetical protein
VLTCPRTTSSYNAPRAAIGHQCLLVFRDVPAEVLERDRDGIVDSIRQEISRIATFLEYGRQDITAANERLRAEVRRAAHARRAKVLADRDTEAMLGVPLARDPEAAKTFCEDVPGQARDEAVRGTGTAVTFASMHQERLRDQILAMLRNVHGEVTGETFSKRGKTDIYLPWQGDGAVFLAECKWWTGPKPFAEHDLPQLLDRYVVWPDTHAAMVVHPEQGRHRSHRLRRADDP